MQIPVSVRAVSTLLALVALSGCKAVVLSYGPDLAAARTNADAFAHAIEQRFTNVVRSPRFSRARMRVARYALAPSKLAPDTSLWTRSSDGPGGTERELLLAASLINGQFSFREQATVAPPARTGDERHLTLLRRLPGENDWRWVTEVDHAIGPMPPSRLNDVVRALFAAAERPAEVMRADYRAAFPRTAQALGRLFTIDSINTAAQSDGSTIVALHVLVGDEALKAQFPALAKFVRKYVEPSRYRFRLSDRTGADWLDTQQAEQRMVVRFRSRRGELQPLLGAARRMPDSLQLHVDAKAKLGLFTVGVSRMQGEFVHVNTPNDRAWAMRFTTEPEWHLPLFTERMLQTPLKRPFEGKGITFRLGVNTGTQGQSILNRQFDVAIRESAIVRFLGNLGFTAMSDFAGAAEAEENRFLAEAMKAMREDIGAMRN